MSRLLADALTALRPNAFYTIRNDEIEWHDEEQTQPTQAEIDAKIAELEAALPLKRLRLKRDYLISQTDWWASSDRTMTAEQTAYRQALRDITDTYTSLDTVVWPTKPE
jgi:phage-related minor tail protein